MKYDPAFQDAIHSNLKAMYKILDAATEETQAAFRHMDDQQQNIAIGTVMVVEPLLEQAMLLYKAIIALHRCKL